MEEMHPVEWLIQRIIILEGTERSRRVVRYQLLRLKMGDHLTHVVRGGARHLAIVPEAKRTGIAPADEVHTLKPDLRAA